MNGKKAKTLRRMARDEMATDRHMYGAKDRELVIANVRGHDRVINDPMTERGFTLQLKKAYKESRHGRK